MLTPSHKTMRKQQQQIYSAVIFFGCIFFLHFFLFMHRGVSLVSWIFTFVLRMGKQSISLFFVLLWMSMEYPLIFPKHFEHPKQSRRMKDLNANKKKICSRKRQTPITVYMQICALCICPDFRRPTCQCPKKPNGVSKREITVQHVKRNVNSFTQ